METDSLPSAALCASSFGGWLADIVSEEDVQGINAKLAAAPLVEPSRDAQRVEKFFIGASRIGNEGVNNEYRSGGPADWDTMWTWSRARSGGAPAQPFDSNIGGTVQWDAGEPNKCAPLWPQASLEPPH